MRLTLLAIGSRGDVQPYVALGRGLARAGHEVTLGTHAPFRAFVEGHGLRFAEVAGNPRELVETDPAQAWLEAGRNPIRLARTMRPLVDDLFGAMTETMAGACRGAEAIVYSGFGFPGYHLAEAMRVPSAAAFLQPVNRTRAFPHSVVGPRRRLPGALNLATHVVAEQVLWQPFRARVNRWRRHELGLPPLPLDGPYRRLRAEHHPILLGYSPAFLPRPADWRPGLEVTGYWPLHEDPDWRASPELEAFLAAGPPPVLVTLGSMRPRDPAALAETVIRGLRRSGRRAIVQAGWAELDGGLDDQILAVGELPHGHVLPRCSAVVHHGGAGTTGAALRAGLPSVVCPVFADQFFWGARVHELGLGPRPLPLGELAAPALASAVAQALDDGPTRARARTLGSLVRSEDGIGRAVQILGRALAG
jgi:UDP:flavonoid glycosyltransferase YjiC (YdhE family)